MSAWLRRVSPVVLGAVLLAAGAAPLRAQTKETADNKAAAKEHYARGTSFYDLGRYDDAIKEFEAAYELKNDPAFLYNLAQSYRQVGNHEQAVHFYKTYLRYVPKSPNKADIEEKIKAEEQLIAQKGTGTTPPPANTSTTPANTTPPTNTTTTPPPAGTEPNVVVPPGTTTPPPGSSPPPGYTPPPTGSTPGNVMPTPTDPGRKFRIAGIASAGAGAVMWVVGIVEWRRAVSASHDVENAAMAMQQFDPAVESRGKSAETAQWVFYGLGALAIGAGAGLWFYGQHVTAAETTTWRVSMAPVVGPNQGGATLRIAF
jgi:tetratricopeptide (TPR) repeat protein